MRRLLVLIAIVLAMFALTVVPTGAITNGQPDAGRHPYVGLIVFDDAAGPAWRCSGTLLSPTVVLTAGHCTDGAVAARVWFAEVVQGNPEYPGPGATSYEGTPHTYPAYCSPCGPGLPGFIAYDVGVVVLSEPVPTSVVSTYGQLPSPNQVERLASGTGIDLVGYGVQERARGEPPNPWTGPRWRLYAPSVLAPDQGRMRELFLKLSANPGRGKGGICFGDSGGPDLLGGTNIVLGVNSIVTNYNCAGVTYSQRVDLPEVLAWIERFL